MGPKISAALRAQAEACWHAALAAVEPGAALRRALAGTSGPAARVHVIAIGKAAGPMARAAGEWLRERGLAPAGGVVIAPSAVEAPPGLPVLAGDHPTPAAGSRRAADALGRAAARVGPDDEAWVLLSGGASSLAAAPAPGVDDDALAALWRLLLDSGLDIHEMNAVRRRFTRWGGGRLAQALAARAIRVYAVSDVPGDDPSAIGSGPCAADPFTREDVLRILETSGLLGRLPSRLLAQLRTPGVLDTLSRGDPALARVHTRIVASNRDAVLAAAARARELGWHAVAAGEPLRGDAAAAGATLAHELLAAPATARVAGGETTVRLDAGAGRGGRCQELALAAARVLHAEGAGGRAVLLAAGTDGRDGPTDAAGAVVDGGTWGRIGAAGRDPAADLARHDSHAALDAAGALLRTGPTGTNVMDLVIALYDSRRSSSSS